MSRKLFILIAVFTVTALILVACGGEEVEDEPAAPAVEAPAEEAAEEPAEEPAEEVAEEPEEMEEMDPCGPSTEGGLTGVDPRGQTIVWWHNHSGSREEAMIPLLQEFTNTNECGITLDPQNQGGYDDIRDKVNNFMAAGDVPAPLLVGYQNDQAFYQLNETLVDLNDYVDDSHWGLTDEEEADLK